LIDSITSNAPDLTPLGGYLGPPVGRSSLEGAFEGPWKSVGGRWNWNARNTGPGELPEPVFLAAVVR
jgi:hypothetical protein